MALPKGNERYETYTDQLVYFSARLAADPKTTSVADAVDAILAGIDEAQDRVRDARRKEVRARAVRDHKDSLGDRKVRRYRREVGLIEQARFVLDRLFARGLPYMTAPRGRAQLDRLAALRAGTQDLLASEQLDAHEESKELREILEQGDAMIGEAIEELEAAMSEWEEQTVELARSRDQFAFRRANGVAQLGAVMGELRALLGGDVRAAYAYTAQSRRTVGDDELDESEYDELEGPTSGEDELDELG